MSATMMTDQLRADENGNPDPYGLVPPPEVSEAEKALLGAMMSSPSAVTEARSLIRVEDFFHGAHQALARLILDMDDSGTPVDPVTVANQIAPRELARMGGAPYLHTLYAGVPTATNADHYAQIVHDHAARRATVRAGMRLMQLGQTHDPDAGPGVLSERVQSVITEYDTELAGGACGPAPIGQDIAGWLDDKLNGEPPTSLNTGLVDLDRLTDVRPGELLVIAARPSIGKTLLGLKMAIHTARQGKPVLMFSLEMTRTELTDRLVSMVCRVEHENLRSKRLTTEDQQRIQAKLPELEQLPLYVEDASELTMSQIKATTRDYRRRHGIELVGIDYLGLVRSDNSNADANRERQVAEMSSGSKALAKDLQIPVMLIAQINRGPESRSDKTPQLSDLRESGAIEADANQVWLMHRPEFTAAPDGKLAPENHPGEVQVIVAKNRGGRTGDDWFSFQPQYQDIRDMPRM